MRYTYVGLREDKTVTFGRDFAARRLYEEKENGEKLLHCSPLNNHFHTLH